MSSVGQNIGNYLSAPWYDLAVPSRKFGKNCSNCKKHPCFFAKGSNGVGPCAKCKYQKKTCSEKKIEAESESDSDEEVEIFKKVFEKGEAMTPKDFKSN